MMQSTATTKEQLCKKCCEILNKSNFAPSKYETELTEINIDYERSSDDLQASADGGCRLCQIIWVGSREHSKCAVYIKFFDRQKSPREVPPIMRLAAENRDNEVRSLMRTTVGLWLDNCSQKHDICRRALASNNKLYSVPTRLIDVGSEDQNTVRLIHTKNELVDDLHTPYLILSYCWGKGNDTAKTTQDNLDQRKQGIAVSMLPKSMSDAIKVTRAMGIRYLWIDAICIIYPDNDGYYDDWTIETAEMGSYYNNALCCISAACAKDSSDGFLRERYIARYPWRENECIPHDGSFFTIQQPPSIAVPTLGNTPLMYRKWALQERILSSRRLHWTNVGLLWECSGGLYRENEPLRNLCQRPQTSPAAQTDTFASWIMAFAPDYHSFPWAQTDTLISQIMTFPKEEALGNIWFYLLQQYFEMRLTVASDSLAAIHGIATRLSLQHNEEYLGGIFKTYCALGLAWTKGEGAALIQGFPSWSWASVDSCHFSYIGIEDVSYSNFTSLARWVDSEQLPVVDTIPNFSSRSMRRIRVQGPLVTLSVNEPHLKIVAESSWSSLYWFSRGPVWQGQAIVITMDCRASATSIPATLDLFVCHKGKSTYFGIIVERSEKDGEGAYVRVGSFIRRQWPTRNEEDNLEKWITEIDIY
ncbi:hypothetical protein MKX08_002217 [Trichoderma sp. CBMAI-0020]|nr:hypothetical protein MKX08_002217 [Trichoderma sp. CBMAI-0020]